MLIYLILLNLFVLTQFKHKIITCIHKHYEIEEWLDFINNNKVDYNYLTISTGISDTDLKKSYRKLAIKHHPDKVAHLGEDHVQVAEDKFQKIQEAYDEIKEHSLCVLASGEQKQCLGNAYEGLRASIRGIRAG